jgi:tyrosyl-tRNA synthetase
LFQFLVRTEDSVVSPYLRYFTWLGRDRIEALDEATATRPEKREAQRALAFEVTSLVHGRDEAERAAHASTVLFSEEIASLDEQTLMDVFAEAPSTVLPREPVALVDVLLSSGLAKSKSDARRHLESGAVYVNNRKVDDSSGSAKLDPSTDVLHGRWVVLRRGKANQHLVRFED